MAENFVSHLPMPGVSSTGIQQLKDMIAISSGAFTDNKTEDLHLIAEGDRVVAHYRWKGINTGPMGEGMPATNKPIVRNGAIYLRAGVQADQGKDDEVDGSHSNRPACTEFPGAL